MDAPHNRSLKDSLRETYDRYAQMRDTGNMQDWKIEVRAKFLALLQQENKKTLLEIGAGPGRDSLFFLGQGLEVVCIDLSPAMVDLCRQKGLTARVMDAAEIDFPAASFDAAYAMNSLLHLPKAELPGVLQRIERVLKPGGLFFMGVYGGNEFEGIWDEDFYEPKRFFSFFTDEGIQRETAKVFEIVSFQAIIVESPGRPHFQSLVLRKKSST